MNTDNKTEGHPPTVQILLELELGLVASIDRIKSDMGLKSRSHTIKRLLEELFKQVDQDSN